MHNFIRTYDPDEVLEPGEPEAVDTSPADARGVYGTGNIGGQRATELQGRGRTLPKPCGRPTSRSWRREGRFSMHLIAYSSYYVFTSGNIEKSRIAFSSAAFLSWW